MVSRNVPPRAAVTTIIPAAGGPSRTTFHSSGEKAALVVMPRSYARLHRYRPMQYLTGCLSGRAPKCSAAGVASGGRRVAWPETMRRSGLPAAGSAAQQLCLGRGELVVGEHALLVQR